jgi:hypothetical protein
MLVKMYEKAQEYKDLSKQSDKTQDHLNIVQNHGQYISRNFESSTR